MEQQEVLYRLGWNWLNKIIPRKSGDFFLIFFDGFGGGVNGFIGRDDFLCFFLNRPFFIGYIVARIGCCAHHKANHYGAPKNDFGKVFKHPQDTTDIFGGRIHIKGLSVAV
jgi:hypothetical protein